MVERIDPRYQETWKDWGQFILFIILVLIFAFSLAYMLVDMSVGV